MSASTQAPSTPTQPVFYGARAGAPIDHADRCDTDRRARPPARRPSRLIFAARPHERDDEVLAIDRRVRGLNAREAAARLALGAHAHELCRGRAYHQLGFARLGDYTRERLGLSPREVESLAQVTTALRCLPAIAAVFARGELSWTHVRLLATIATTEDEASWLESARGCSGTTLAALVRRAGTPSPAAASSPERASAQCRIVEAAVDEALDLTEGEPAIRFHLRCPARLRGFFYDTVELARRAAGESLPIPQVAETIAAEALSGAPRGDWAWHPPAAPALPPSRADAMPSAADSAPSRAVAAPACQGSPILTAAPMATASPRDLDARLRRAVAALRAVDGEVGRALIEIRERRLHRAVGSLSFADYVSDRIGIAPRTARALMAAERAASTSGALAAAYRAGELSWLQTLTLAPVVAHAPVEMAASWVARARRVTLRRLTDEVAWVLACRDAGEPGPFPPPSLDCDLRRDGNRQIGALSAVSAEHPSPAALPELLDAGITFTGPASIVALLQTAISAFAVIPNSSSSLEPRWRSCERMLRHVQATWLALPHHPDPIFARDGWRCTVPACSGRRNLHDHHVRFRSRGGDNRRSNRITVCAWHHLRAIHCGLVRGWGTAPHGIRWQLGVNNGGASALVELLGDRYLDDAEVMADRLIHP